MSARHGSTASSSSLSSAKSIPGPNFVLNDVLSPEALAESGITRPRTESLSSLSDIDLPPVRHPLLIPNLNNDNGPFWDMEEPQKFQEAFDIGLRLVNYLLYTTRVKGKYARVLFGAWQHRASDNKWFLENITNTPAIRGEFSAHVTSKACTKRLRYLCCTATKPCWVCTKMVSESALAMTGPLKTKDVNPEAEDISIEFNTKFGQYATAYDATEANRTPENRYRHIRVNFIFAVTLSHELVHFFEFARGTRNTPFHPEPHGHPYLTGHGVHYHESRDTLEWGVAFEQDIYGGFLRADDDDEIIPDIAVCMERDEKPTGERVMEVLSMDRVLNWFDKEKLDDVFKMGEEWPVEEDIMKLTFDVKTYTWKIMRELETT
ncbi:hypothetical protein BT63DRAFT_449108 [Microthyrium microscopicum]|uniref:Uncharacterized protein n=1 Tax=Microthyrium microscopicum TaxID=703497 RepID=A0A6A6UQS2_9PEZI|nr:hypothetical protein BT63DRAFT_449108 [Microthyrium microscopicum]